MSLLRDLRFGARSLRKSPGLMVVATLALSFGIGLTATMWSIIYGAMIKGLPYDDPQSIVAVFRTNPSRDIDRMGVTAHDYADWVPQQKSFEMLGASTCGTINVSGVEKAERFDGCWMTAAAMAIPRITPLMGRLFRTDEDRPGGERVAIISHAMWQSRYGSGGDIVGKPIRVNGHPHTIVGVMPEGFLYPNNTRIWVPLVVDPAATTRANSPQYQVIGRLKPGISLDEANAELNAIAKRIEADNKATNEGVQALVQPYVKAFIGDEPTRLLYTMLGAVGLVLLIACANVANLLLDRAAHRTKEVGIRTALGASRFAVVRQFLAEAVILSLLGAAVGTGIAYVGTDLFNRAILDTQPPFFIDIRLHPPVLLFIGGVALLASLVSGFLPAFQSSRADINEILKDESRGASSLRIGKLSKALVVFEIALSCGLLVAAGLMTKSVTKLRNIDPGFEGANVFTARVGFPAGVATDSATQRLFWDQLPGRLAQIPGAVSASVSTGLPGVNMNNRAIVPEGKTFERRQDMPEARSVAVTPDFFKTFGMPIRQGRAFSSADRLESAPVAIINEKFAATHFPGVDPLGRRFRIQDSRDSLTWRTIVGVVANVYVGDNENPWAPAFFTPFAQEPSNFASMSVLNSGPPMAITQQVRDAVASLDPDLPLYWVYSMPEAIARPTWFVRVFGTMFMIFGGIALFLAGIGLYAVMAFSVSRRTREVGIRMALGAKAADVVRMIFGQGMWQLGIGLVLGLGLAAGVSQLLSLILFDVQPRDPMIFGGVVAVLAAAGLLACLIPAARATRVDPMVALR
ncbi:MAG: ABC transporter permease, partial [Gemmatimonadaceae bacterium]